MGTFKKIGMIILVQHRLEDAVTFYKKMGLELKFHLENQWAEFELEGIKLGLCPATAEQPPRRTGIVFEVEDLKALHSSMEQEGVPFLAEPLEKIHGLMASFKDPGNNIIDLYQPTPEKVRELVSQAAQGDEEGCCEKGPKCCKAEA